MAYQNVLAQESTDTKYKNVLAEDVVPKYKNILGPTDPLARYSLVQGTKPKPQNFSERLKAVTLDALSGWEQFARGKRGNIDALSWEAVTKNDDGFERQVKELMQDPRMTREKAERLITMTSPFGRNKKKGTNQQDFEFLGVNERINLMQQINEEGVKFDSKRGQKLRKEAFNESKAKIIKNLKVVEKFIPDQVYGEDKDRWIWQALRDIAPYGSVLIPTSVGTGGIATFPAMFTMDVGEKYHKNIAKINEVAAKGLAYTNMSEKQRKQQAWDAAVVTGAPSAAAESLGGLFQLGLVKRGFGAMFKKLGVKQGLQRLTMLALGGPAAEALEENVQLPLDVLNDVIIATPNQSMEQRWETLSEIFQSPEYQEAVKEVTKRAAIAGGIFVAPGGAAASTRIVFDTFEWMATRNLKESAQATKEAQVKVKTTDISEGFEVLETQPDGTVDIRLKDGTVKNVSPEVVQEAEKVAPKQVNDPNKFLDSNTELSNEFVRTGEFTIQRKTHAPKRNISFRGTYGLARYEDSKGTGAKLTRLETLIKGGKWKLDWLFKIVEKLDIPIDISVADPRQNPELWNIDSSNKAEIERIYATNGGMTIVNHKTGRTNIVLNGHIIEGRADWFAHTTIAHELFHGIMRNQLGDWGGDRSVAFWRDMYQNVWNKISPNDKAKLKEASDFMKGLNEDEFVKELLKTKTSEQIEHLQNKQAGKSTLFKALTLDSREVRGEELAAYSITDPILARFMNSIVIQGVPGKKRHTLFDEIIGKVSHFFVQLVPGSQQITAMEGIRQVLQRHLEIDLDKEVTQKNIAKAREDKVDLAKQRIDILLEKYLQRIESVRAREKNESEVFKDPDTGKEFTAPQLRAQMKKEGIEEFNTPEFARRRGYTAGQRIGFEATMGMYKKAVELARISGVYTEDKVKEMFEFGEELLFADTKVKSIPDVGELTKPVSDDGATAITVDEIRKFERNHEKSSNLSKRAYEQLNKTISANIRAIRDDYKWLKRAIKQFPKHKEVIAKHRQYSKAMLRLHRLKNALKPIETFRTVVKFPVTEEAQKELYLFNSDLANLSARPMEFLAEFNRLATKISMKEATIDDKQRFELAKKFALADPAILEVSRATTKWRKAEVDATRREKTRDAKKARSAQTALKQLKQNLKMMKAALDKNGNLIPEKKILSDEARDILTRTTDLFDKKLINKKMVDTVTDYVMKTMGEDTESKIEKSIKKLYKQNRVREEIIEEQSFGRNVNMEGHRQELTERIERGLNSVVPGHQFQLESYMPDAAGYVPSGYSFSATNKASPLYSRSMMIPDLHVSTIRARVNLLMKQLLDQRTESLAAIGIQAAIKYKKNVFKGLVTDTHNQVEEKHKLFRRAINFDLVEDGFWDNNTEQFISRKEAKERYEIAYTEDANRGVDHINPDIRLERGELTRLGRNKLEVGFHFAIGVKTRLAKHFGKISKYVVTKKLRNVHLIKDPGTWDNVDNLLDVVNTSILNYSSVTQQERLLKLHKFLDKKRGTGGEMSVGWIELQFEDAGIDSVTYDALESGTRALMVFNTKGIKEDQRTESKVDPHPFQKPSMQDDYEFGSKGIEDVTWKEKITKWYKDLISHFREFADIEWGERGETAKLTYTVRKLMKQKAVAFQKAIVHLRGMIEHLTVEQYDLLQKVVVLKDLNEQIEVMNTEEAEAKRKGEKYQRRALPYKWKEQDVKNELVRYWGKMKADQVVFDAFYTRMETWDNIRTKYMEAMSKAGYDVSSRLKRRHYFRHQVMKHILTLRGKGPKGEIGLVTPSGRGFLKKRKGSELPINFNLVQADHEVMAQMLYDIEIADVITLVRNEYDAITIARQTAEKYNKTHADKKTWQEMLPSDINDTHRAFEPVRGHVMYMAESIPAKLANLLHTKQLKSLSVTEKDLNKVMVMGRHYDKMLLPNTIADFLDNSMKFQERSEIGKLFRNVMKFWKGYQLMHPYRLLKYNTRNLTGDAEAVFVGNPKVFLFAKAALKDISTWKRTGKVEGHLKDFFERGGGETTMQAQEISSLLTIDEFNKFFGANRKKRAVKQGISFYYRKARGATDARELWLRYAAYLEGLNQIQKHGKIENYGASMKEEVDALSGKRDKAFMIANDLLGAYDRVSGVGQQIRAWLIPFWSFQEVNMSRAVHLMRNAALNDKIAFTVGRQVIGKTARFTIRNAIRVGKIVLVYNVMGVVMNVWNNFMFPDEEDSLPEEMARRNHIILWGGENVLYFPRLGITGDLLEWVGGEYIQNDVMDLMMGRATLDEIIQRYSKGEGIKGVGKDLTGNIANKIVQSLGPQYKTTAEAITAWNFFPDVFNPKPIFDRGVHLAKQYNFEFLYNKVMGKPSHKWGEWAADTAIRSAVYRQDMDRLAYIKIQDLKDKFLKRLDKRGHGFMRTDKGTALYNFAVSWRYGDYDSVVKYIVEYVKAGGEPKGIKRKLKNLDPLAHMDKKIKDLFMASLDKSDIKALVRAFKYYGELLGGVQF